MPVFCPIHIKFKLFDYVNFSFSGCNHSLPAYFRDTDENINYFPKEETEGKEKEEHIANVEYN